MTETATTEERTKLLIELKGQVAQMKLRLLEHELATKLTSQQLTVLDEQVRRLRADIHSALSQGLAQIGHYDRLQKLQGARDAIKHAR